MDREYKRCRSCSEITHVNHLTDDGICEYCGPALCMVCRVELTGVEIEEGMCVEHILAADPEFAARLECHHCETCAAIQTLQLGAA